MAALLLLLLAGSLGLAPARSILRGFTSVGSARERTIESQFSDIPTAASALAQATVISARPHYAGTPADYALASWMRDELRSFGLDARLEALTARVDTPRELVLELAPPADLAATAERSGRHAGVKEFPVALQLAEAPEPADPATAIRAIGLPFNAGCADGDVRAPLVYAGRGRDTDYATLAGANVDVRGAVVLVRYGAQFRGLLAQRAQARGAAGVVFYDDPQDDGSARGPAYPAGPWRPATAVQRGWVGNGITIPTLPISAANAQLLLASLRGDPGPAGWSGALPVDYPLARGPGRVHLIVKLNRKPTTLWNTVAIVRGVHDDQRIVLGAHRDAWVFGAGDDGAGIAVLLEVARGFAFLRDGGWQPQRTIVIAGWDGEEIGLAGSRAYVAEHRFELERGGVGYLDADEPTTGSAFGAGAAPAIAPLLVDVSHAVPDPDAPATAVYDRWFAQTPAVAPVVTEPGGGDDEAFRDGSGTPTAEFGFRGPFGVYHSSYDTLRYATTMSDPDFARDRAAAQLYGLAALRLADAQTVPYTLAGYTPLLRTSAARLPARHRAGVARAVERLARLSARLDATIAQAPDDLWPRERRAVRALDALVYGGSTSVRLDRELDAALALPDARDTGAALAQAAARIDRSADTFAR